MLLTKMFAFRMNAHEKAMLTELAKELKLSQSDVIRSLIRETLIVLKSQPAGDEHPQTKKNRMVGGNDHV
jgi:hypothetical protein